MVYCGTVSVNYSLLNPTNMRKLKRFVLAPSCQTLSGEAMTEIVGGVEANNTCDFHATADTCSGYCDYEGKSGTCTYGEVALWTGCYCVIE